MMRTRFALALLLGVLGCKDLPTAVAPLPDPEPKPGKVLGVIALRVNVTGPGEVRTSTSFFRADAADMPGPRFALTGDEVIQGDHIGPIFETMDGGGSFTDGAPGAGGYRYVFMSAKVRNAGVNNLVTPPDTAAFTTPRQNLTMIAIEVPAGGGFGVPGTPFADLMKFDGTPANPAIAEGIVPTGAVRQTLTGDITTHSPDVLQVFTEAEAAAASPFFDPFPYGYVIYHVTETTNRTLAANPGPTQYDGIITLGLKIPLQANPADDVYGFSMFFVLREDSETRITQSIEEQDAAGQAAFEARVAALATGPGGLSGITLLSGGSYGGSVPAPVRKLCAVRIAGPVGAPTAFLDGSAAGSCPTLTSVSASVGGQGTTENVTLTGTNFVIGAGNTTVTVSGSDVTVDNVVVNSETELTADFEIAGGAAAGARSVTVTTAAGSSGSQTFTVLPPTPTLTGLSPSTGAPGTFQSVTLTGTGFIDGIGATTVAVTGDDVIAVNVTFVSGTELTADFLTDGPAALGGRDVTVTTDGGTSTAQTFTVVPAPGFGSFTAAPSILTVVQPTELAWSTTDATSCSIDNGVGTVACTGSMIVTPGSSMTYTLSASAGGATISATADVSVGAPGQFLYVVSQGPAVDAAPDPVHMFEIDAANGTLTPIGAGTINAGNEPYGIAVDPEGRYAYVANRADDNISMFTINSTTGALTANGVVPAGNDVRAIVVDPTGRYAYAVNQNTIGVGSVSAYVIDGTGVLLPNGNYAADVQPLGIAVDPLGRYVYVTNAGAIANDVSMYVINADGTLTDNGTVAAGGASLDIAVDPTGRFVYVLNAGDNSISMYSIQADGTLTPLAPPTITDGITTAGLAVDPTGQYAYKGARAGDDDVRMYTLTSSTGVLVANAPDFIDAGDNPFSIAIDPSGKFLYVVNNGSDDVSMYSIEPDGTLSSIGTIPAGDGPQDLAVSR